MPLNGTVCLSSQSQKPSILGQFLAFLFPSTASSFLCLNETLCRSSVHLWKNISPCCVHEFSILPNSDFRSYFTSKKPHHLAHLGLLEGHLHNTERHEINRVISRSKRSAFLGWRASSCRRVPSSRLDWYPT